MKKRTRKNKKYNKSKTRKVYKKGDFKSGDGMLTSVWGPSLWHYLHCMSFNYPVKPTAKDKMSYKKFITSFKFVLPCKYCRMNFRKNLKPLIIDCGSNIGSSTEYFLEFLKTQK